MGFSTDDTIYVTNYRQGTIGTFSCGGLNRGVLARLNYPVGIAYDVNNNLYVSSDDPAGYKVMKYAVSDGATTTYCSANLNAPHGIAFDSNRNLYVANAKSNLVQKFDENGVYVGTFGTGYSHPVGLAFDADGNLYVASAWGGTHSNGSIQKVETDGTTTTFATDCFNIAFGLVFDGEGILYVSSFQGNTITAFDTDGTNLGVWSDCSGLSQPHGLIFDETGNMYVCNVGNATVESLSASGGDQGLFARTGGGPHFIVAGSKIPRHA